MFISGLKQEVRFYSRQWMLGLAMAFGKRWYDSHHYLLELSKRSLG